MVGRNEAGEVHITREFDAPRELVFKAWTDAEHMTRWYAPHGCSITFRACEFRVGGAIHSCIKTPDGHNCWCKGVYRNIVASERIEYTMAVADANGNSLTPIEAGMDPDWPAETLVTVTFEPRGAKGEKTLLTLHQTVSETLAKKTGAHPSWLQMLDRLAENGFCALE
jgi:uncharacterized protein YndB with AHSA1/START domain